MTVSTSFALGFVTTIETFGIGAVTDAASLVGGGAAIVGARMGLTDSVGYDSAGEMTYVTTGFAGTEAALARLGDGNLVIARDTGTDIVFSIRTADGDPVLNSTALNENNVGYADVAGGLTGGRFVVAYQDHFTATDNDIEFRIFANDGSPVEAVVIDSTNADDQAPSVATLADGGFVIAWHRIINGNSHLWRAVYNADGTVRQGAAEVDMFGTINRNASVVAFADGGYGIAYEDNGWPSGVDTEITLMRFNAAGSLISLDQITDNEIADCAPSATLMSNGMVLVGSTSGVGAEADAAWSLVKVTGAGGVFARSEAGSTAGGDGLAAVAALGLGQVATFFTDETTGAAVGQILQALHYWNGDSDDDQIVGDDLRDIVHGGGGADTIRGGPNRDGMYGDGGNDLFVFGDGEVAAGETISGGADTDRIVVHADTDFTEATLLSIEEIQFDFGNPTQIDVNAGQFGAGLALNLLVVGRTGFVADTLRIAMGAELDLNLSGLVFQDFLPDDPTEQDRILVVGDNGSETIVGSSIRDDILGGGGHDRIAGGGGADKLRGGLGNDVYTVNAAGEAVEAANQGSDTVRSAIGYGLGANIEKLLLTGTANINGSGNALDNFLTGNSGANILNGGGGKDAMTGGAGADQFFFNSPVEGLANIDKILDFTAGLDRLRLDDAIFVGLSNAGRAAAFHIGAAAADALDRIIYNDVTGALYFDPDGLGGAAQVKFAILDPGLDLKPSDLLIV